MLRQVYRHVSRARPGVAGSRVRARASFARASNRGSPNTFCRTGRDAEIRRFADVLQQERRAESRLCNEETCRTRNSTNEPGSCALRLPGARLASWASQVCDLLGDRLVRWDAFGAFERALQRRAGRGQLGRVDARRETPRFEVTGELLEIEVARCVGSERTPADPR